MNLYPVLILAGGLATRLRPITEKIPKALVEVGGQPFIYHQLRLLASKGVQNIVISTWYQSTMIKDYVGNGKQFGLKVEYVIDGDFPLGTGGAVRKALPLFRSPFFVLYGDSYLPCDYAAIQAYFSSKQFPALMTVFHNQGKWDISNVKIVDDKIVEYDKKKHSSDMKYIDYGLSLFIPDVFENMLYGKPTDLTGVYHQLIFDKRLLAYEVKQRFYEIGSFEGLRELDKLLSSEPDLFLKKEKT